MSRVRALPFVLCLAGCGLSVVGVGTLDEPDAAPALREASADVEVADVGAPDAAVDDADGVEDADAALDAQDAADANPCVACATGTAQTACVNGKCTTVRRLFTTSESFKGDFGGLAGADAKCQSAATAANLGGTWKAWLSSSTTAVRNRLTFTNVPYVLVDGTFVSTTSFSGTLAHAIREDETGKDTGNAEVWTGTSANGSSDNLQQGATVNDYCNDWQSSTNSHTAVVGTGDRTGTDFTENFLQFCDRSDHLYCFEQ